MVDFWAVYFLLIFIRFIYVLEDTLDEWNLLNICFYHARIDCIANDYNSLCKDDWIVQTHNDDSAKYFSMFLLLHVNFVFFFVSYGYFWYHSKQQMKHIHENSQLSFWKHFVFCLIVFFKELDLFLAQIGKFNIQFLVRNIAKIIFSFIP